MNTPGTAAWMAPEVSDARKNPVRVSNKFQITCSNQCLTFKAKSSDVFSLGCVFFFVISGGTILSQKLDQKYTDIDTKLKTMLKDLIQKDKESQQFLQMDLIPQTLNLKPELRPSAQQILHHPLCWDDKKCLEFIVAIRNKFDFLDATFIKKVKKSDERQMVLRETPAVENLRDALDLNKSYVNIGWTAKLDCTLASELDKNYKTNSVSDLLRAIRNKVLKSFDLFIMSLLYIVLNF